MTQDISPVDHLWTLAASGKVVPIADIPALQLVSDATRTTMVQQGIVPAIKVGGRWYSDSTVVIDAMRQEHDRNFSALGGKKHHKRGASKAGRSAVRREQFDKALTHLQGIGIAPKK